MYRYLILFLSLIITGCSQNDTEQSKGTGSSTPSTAITHSASAEKTARIALVIGNSDYDENFNKLQLEKLRNPVNDAKDMATVLRHLGFEVILKTNARKKTAMKQAVREFIERLGQHDEALFYFSGHGFQQNNINYLVPLRADIHNDIDIEGEALPAKYVLKQMERATRGVKLMILDACRSNIPDDFFRKSKGAFSGVSKGFSSSLNAPMNTLIIYATAANKVSWGGLPGERNSVYTKHLVDVLRQQPHAMVEILLKEVRYRVVQETEDTGEPQVPWESGSLVMQPFCFGACGSEEQRKLKQQRAELEQQRVELERQRAQLERDKSRQHEEATKLAEQRLKAKQEHSISQSQETEKRELAQKAQKLHECDKHFQANRLTIGKGGNALVCYRAVLKKYPNNAQALTGLNKIESYFVTFIKRFLDQGQLEKAKQYLASLRKVNPKSVKLAILETKLQTLKAEQESLASQKEETEKRELAQKLRECDKHFQANRLTSGKGGTALACYKAVLKKAPKNAQALKGLKNIEERYVKWAERALKKGQSNKAKRYLASLRKVNPESSNLATLETRLLQSLKSEVLRLLQICKIKNDMTKALTCYENVLKKESTNTEALVGLEKIYRHYDYEIWINEQSRFSCSSNDETFVPKLPKSWYKMKWTEKIKQIKTLEAVYEASFDESISCLPVSLSR